MGRYGHQGTLYTCSINVLHGYNISRRDDLESLGYAFMKLINLSSITWMKCATADRIQEMIQLKKEFISEEVKDP